MGFYAAFVHGSRTWTLNQGDDIVLASTYEPPQTSVNVSMSSGLMGNRLDGGTVTGRQFTDRSMTIPLHSKGTTVAETHGNISALESFIERSLMDTSYKLYFVFGASDAVTYTPKWGQNFRKYEVKAQHGAAINRDIYMVADIKENFIGYMLPLTVAPFAVGERQRVGSATGGILEHTWATPDGLSRGLVIPEARTNEISNPIFGHGTYDTGWTDGAELNIAKNTDSNYVLCGSNSVKMTAVGATTNTMSITVTCIAALHIFGAYFKRQDGGVVDNSVIAMAYDGNALTENYISVGNGWYLVYAFYTGTAAPAIFSFFVINKHTVYMDMVFAEVGTSPVAPLHGDMLDCAWAGTAHESDSTRTEARWMINSGEVCTGTDMWTASATILTKGYSVNLTADIDVFAMEDAYRLYFDYSSSYWIFTDGTNSINGATTTYDPNDIITFHAVISLTGLKLYIDGVEYATGATFTPPTLPTSLYLGTNWAVNNHINATFLNFCTYDRALTSAQVLADYNNVSAYVNSGDGLGKCLNPIPWLWTDDGDDTVDDCFDSTRENWCVYGGVPGNYNAKTEFYINRAGSTTGYFGLSLQDNVYNFNATDAVLFFSDCSGTAATAECGEAVQVEAVIAGGGATFVTAPYIVLPHEFAYSKDYYIVARLKDAGTLLKAKILLYYKTTGGLTTLYDGDLMEIAPVAASYGLFKIGPVNVTNNLEAAAMLPYKTAMALQVNRDAAGSPGNVTVDFYGAAPEPFIYVIASDRVYLSGKTAYGLDTDMVTSVRKYQTAGNGIHLIPERANLIYAYNDFAVSGNAIGSNLIFTTYVTPRWSLL